MLTVNAIYGSDIAVIGVNNANPAHIIIEEG